MVNILKKRSSLFSRRKKSKISQHSKTKKNTSKFGVWGKFGFVYSPKRKTYIRLGTNESFNVLQNELTRDNEWYKRVKLMSKKNNIFGNKLKTLL